MAGLRKFLGHGGRLVAFLAVALVASCTTRIWDAVHEPYPALPPLLQNLPGNFAPGAENKFNARLAARFPVGTPEVNVIRALWLEGFQPVIARNADPRFVRFTRMGDLIHGICRHDGFVKWSADAQGRLSAISGRYFVDC